MRCAWITWCAFGVLALVSDPTTAEELVRTIRVTGQGKAAAPPDMATINTGVETEASTASEALQDNNRAMEKIMTVLQQHHIASKDVQTSSFNVSPLHKRDSRGRAQPEVVGYRVIHQVRVRVRNLPDLGKVLDALVKAGSNRVSGVSFGIDDPTGVLNQARNRAIGDARSRAQLYAHVAGVRVGKVQTISEQPVQMPRPIYLGARMAVAQEAAVPVATGEQDFQVTVHMVFALEDAR